MKSKIKNARSLYLTRAKLGGACFASQRELTKDELLQHQRRDAEAAMDSRGYVKFAPKKSH